MNSDAIYQSTKSIVLVVGLCIFTWGIYQAFSEWKNHFELKNELINEQMIKLADNIVNQRAEINTKLLEQRMKELDKRIIDLVNSRDQQITDIGKSISSLSQSFHESQSNYHNDEDESKDYDEVAIFNKDITSEDDSPLPLGWAIYSPNIDSEEKWTVGNYKLNFEHQIVLAENDERLDVIMEAWITPEGYFPNGEVKKFPLKIDEVNWIRKEPESKWGFNPRLALGVSLGTEVYPNLGVSFFSYGKTKRDMDWKFLKFSIGGNNDNIFLQLNPVEYNIGNVIPLIENIFIGPYINLSDDSEYGFGLGLNVPF